MFSSARTAERAGEGSGAAFGTKAHTILKEEVKALESAGANVHPEDSYKAGEIVNYGTPGSVGVDVVPGDKLAPKAISDLKTGGAKLTPPRVQQIRQHLPKGSQAIPINEVRLPQ